MPTKTPPNRKSTARRAPSKKKALRRMKPKPKSEWNILCYFAGDGILSATMISQLKELTDAGYQEDTNVLAYFDPNCNGRNARIFDVNALRKEEGKRKGGQLTIIGDREDSYVRNIAEDCHVPGLPQIPAAITLRYFLEYARAYYPAKNYMLFMMGHGVIVGNDSFLPDPDDNSAITLVDLGWILRTFANKVREGDDEFQVVGFHSCSMSSVELAYELAGSARYMIGTQGAAFPGSWPYRQLLKKVLSSIDQARRGKLPKSREVIDKDPLINTILYGLQDLSFYNSADFWLAGFSSDLSLCRLDVGTVGKLREPISRLSKALKAGLALKNNLASTNAIRLAHLESQSYWNETYTDLHDFCECLSKRSDGPTKVEKNIKNACDSVLAALALSKGRRTKALVPYSDYYGPAYQYSNGLSIYFPWRRPKETVLESYQRNKFTREHFPDSWLSFLVEYFYATQRDARHILEPAGRVPELAPSVRWRPEDNLLKELSDKRLLSLGPPPRKLSTAPSMVGGDLSRVGDGFLRLGRDLQKIAGGLDRKVGVGLSKVGAELSTVGTDLSKVGADLAGKIRGDLPKIGVDLSQFLNGDLSKISSDLSRIGGDLLKMHDDLPGKIGGDLSKIGSDLLKVGGHLRSDKFEELSKIGGDLSKLLGNLSKVGGDLSKVGGGLSKVGGDLASKIGGDLAAKIGADLASKIGTDLAAKIGADLASKVGADLASKIGADLASKIGADLASKIGGDLASKIGGDLASKIGGDLASKIGGDLASKIGGDLASKIGGDLASKIGSDLGGFHGHTVIKNFETPEDSFVTSRWYIGDDSTNVTTNGTRKRSTNKRGSSKASNR